MPTLTKVFPRGWHAISPSAMWEVAALPGLCLLRHTDSTIAGQPGWVATAWSAGSPLPAAGPPAPGAGPWVERQLQGQVFPTLREAVATALAVAELYDLQS